VGAPLADLEDTLVPLYLLHRYQTEAATKIIGGLDFRYQLRGDGQMNAEIVAADEQRKALRAVVKTLSTETLTLPESLLKLLPPRPPGFPRTHESLPAQTGPSFDPIAAAESAADMTLGVLFDPERAARLVEYHARANAPSLAEVMDAALEVSRPAPKLARPAQPATRSAQPINNSAQPINNAAQHPAAGGHQGLGAEIQGAVYARTVEALLRLAADPKDSVEVRGIAYAKLEEVKRRSDANSPLEAYLIHRIQQFQSDPAKFVAAKPVEAPPGMPIGDDEF
jgi:hypothetical protein